LNYLTTYYWKIVAWDNHGASAVGPVWHFTTIAKPNQPPNTPNTPTPANGATDVPISPVLSWLGGDPDPSDTVTYDVYFGTSGSPPKVVSNQTDLTYNPGTLLYNTVYYWKIVAWDNHSASAEGPVWHFTTISEPEHPPNTPSTPTPADGATGVSVSTTLSWFGGDPDPGDTVTYDIYFGSTSPPPLLVNNHTGTSYQPAVLQGNTTYYWRIIAWDNHHVSAAGAEWSFTTEVLGDTTPPSVQITRPENAIYLRNNKILPFIVTVAIGAIDVEVTANDTESGVAMVEFYVDGVFKANDTTAPYTWTWSERGFFIYTLRVIAYDTVGNHAKAEMKVFKFF
jgi:hypothetical protein